MPQYTEVVTARHDSRSHAEIVKSELECTYFSIIRTNKDDIRKALDQMDQFITKTKERIEDAHQDGSSRRLLADLRETLYLWYQMYHYWVRELLEHGHSHADEEWPATFYAR